MFDLEMLRETGTCAGVENYSRHLTRRQPGEAPFTLLDFVGLDVSQAIGEAIGAEVPARVRELVADGALGKKSGRGFYRYG